MKRYIELLTDGESLSLYPRFSMHEALHTTKMYRVRALEGNIHAPLGTIGGWMDEESFEASQGNFWIADDSKVIYSIIDGNIFIRHYADIKGVTIISEKINDDVHTGCIIVDRSVILGNVIIRGSGHIISYTKIIATDELRIYGDIKIYDTKICITGTNQLSNIDITSSYIYGNLSILGEKNVIDRNTNIIQDTGYNRKSVNSNIKILGNYNTILNSELKNVELDGRNIIYGYHESMTKLQNIRLKGIFIIRNSYFQYHNEKDPLAIETDNNAKYYYFMDDGLYLPESYYIINKNMNGSAFKFLFEKRKFHSFIPIVKKCLREFNKFMLLDYK